MDQFVLLFRLDILTEEAQPSPEQLQVYMKQYQDWVGGIPENPTAWLYNVAKNKARIIFSASPYLNIR